MEYYTTIKKEGSDYEMQMMTSKIYKWQLEGSIKKRWQEYTEELCKKDLHDPDNHDGVITHLEPDILEWMWSQVGLRKYHYKQS